MFVTLRSPGLATLKRVDGVDADTVAEAVAAIEELHEEERWIAERSGDVRFRQVDSHQERRSA